MDTEKNGGGRRQDEDTHQWTMTDQRALVFLCVHRVSVVKKTRLD